METDSQSEEASNSVERKSNSSGTKKSKRQRQKNSSRNNGEKNKEKNSDKSENPGLYEVEEIIKKRVKHGQTQYWIKWKGYASKSNTWEPIENLQEAQDILKKFEKEQKLKESSNSKKIQKQKPETNGKQSHPKQTLQKKLSTQKSIKIEKEQKNVSDRSHNKQQKEHQEKIKNLKGSISNGDRPYKILGIHQILMQQNPPKIIFNVEWEVRENNEKPHDSQCTNDELKQTVPIQLCEFYEQKICIVNGQQQQNAQQSKQQSSSQNQQQESQQKQELEESQQQQQSNQQNQLQQQSSQIQEEVEPAQNNNNIISEEENQKQTENLQQQQQQDEQQTLQQQNTSQHDHMNDIINSFE